MSHTEKEESSSQYLTCFHAVMLVVSLGPLHRTAAACLGTCFWRRAVETRSASAVRGRVGEEDRELVLVNAVEAACIQSSRAL
ncbi:unnamed protein product [Pleuronectes platessa]|uniref:Uncharacterized protein n=1 Tax=Pleuronectes platessa TaxID=8262 RepID=A0A9N7YN86_PLEPL|nr:unnamed protein product [Pleuronectes platessa]